MCPRDNGEQSAQNQYSGRQLSRQRGAAAARQTSKGTGTRSLLRTLTSIFFSQEKTAYPSFPEWTHSSHSCAPPFPLQCSLLDIFFNKSMSLFLLFDS